MNEEQLKIKITAEIADAKKGLKEAQETVKKTTKSVKDETKKIDDAFGKLGKSIGNGLKAGAKAAATAIAGIGTSLVGTAVLTEEYRTAQAKLSTAFETAGASANTAKDTYNDLYRVLGDGDVAVEAANHLAKLTTNEQDLNEWTTICQGVFATFGDSLPIEGLTEAANETAKTGALTGSLADALNWCGIAEEEFQAQLDACNTESEREALIRETLNGAYSEAAANYEKNAAAILAQNEAEAHMQESLAALGEAMTPFTTMLTELGATVLEQLTPYIQSFAENYLPTIQTILETVVTHLGSALTFLNQHKAILAVMAGIIGGIATAIGLYNVVAAVKAAMDAAQVTTLGALVAAYAAQAAAMIVAIAPYALIVAAIAAVIAIIVVCIKHWDKIKETVVKVANAIKQKVIEMKDAVVEKFNEIKNNITEKVNAIKEKVVSVFTNIKDAMKEKIQAAKDTVLGIFDGIKTGIREKIDAAKDFVKTAIDKIKGFFNFHWELPKIKLPHFSIKGKFSLDPPSIPHFSVSWYARGGVFDKPNLFGYGNGNIGGLGENGAEAVVPLEKNTQWLDKIADKLASRQGSRPIVLEVDGRVFAQVSCDTINDLTRQTGSLPIRVI